jgi:polyribonucleotide nucleotidyltransferase
MDRPLRPLFPDGFRRDTQIIATVLSADKINPTDVLALTGASAALHISEIPWSGPVVGIRVGRIEGEFVAYPTFEQQEKSDIDLVVAASKEAIVMVEGGAAEASEGDIVEALMLRIGRRSQSSSSSRRSRRLGKPKREFGPRRSPTT